MVGPYGLNSFTKHQFVFGYFLSADSISALKQIRRIRTWVFHSFFSTLKLSPFAFMITSFANVKQICTFNLHKWLLNDQNHFTSQLAFKSHIQLHRFSSFFSPLLWRQTFGKVLFVENVKIFLKWNPFNLSNWNAPFACVSA